MEWKFDVYVAGLLFAALVSLSIAITALQHRKRPGALALGLMMFAIAEWAIAYVFEANAVTIQLHVLWSQIAYVGTVISPVFLFIFTAQFVHRDRWLTPPNIALLSVIPVITLVLAATNGQHGLVWSGTEFATGTRHIVRYHHGSWFWIFTTFVYTLFLMTVLMLISAARRMHRTYRRQSLTMLLAILPSTISNATYILTPELLNGRDWTPVSLFFSAALLAWAFSELQLLNLAPLAKDIVLDSIQDGVIVINADRRIVDANPAAHQLLSAGDIIGLEITGAMIGVEGAPSQLDLDAALSTVIHSPPSSGAEARSLSGEIITPDARYIRWDLSPIEHRRAHLPGYLLILRDVTERLLAEAALREMNATLEAKVVERTAAIQAQQEQSDAILRSVSDAIIMTDRDLIIRFVNPAFTTLAGYSFDETLGEPARAFVGDAVYAHLKQAQVDGEAWQGESIAQLSDGRRKEIELTIAPVADASQSTVGYVCTEHDISKTKNLDRTRKGILDNISHQLRTPVTTLRLYTHLLRQADLPEQHQRSFKIINDQILWLQTIIEEILEMTALDSGQAIRLWENLPIDALLDHLVAKYQARITNAGLRLHLHLDPQLGTEFTVRGDPSRLIQAAGEIVQNAISFTPSGGAIWISAMESTADGTQGVAIKVRDTGPGVPDIERPRVFDRFFRGQITESGQIPGAGLGLNIAQAIIAAHNGTINLQSNHQGTTVTIWLPCAEPEASREA